MRCTHEPEALASPSSRCTGASCSPSGCVVLLCSRSRMPGPAVLASPVSKITSKRHIKYTLRLLLLHSQQHAENNKLEHARTLSFGSIVFTARARMDTASDMLRARRQRRLRDPCLGIASAATASRTRAASSTSTSCAAGPRPSSTSCRGPAAKGTHNTSQHVTTHQI